MPNRWINFAHGLGLVLSPTQIHQLETYARCVWEKKDFLNLTSTATLAEVFTRHICDGLQAAAALQPQLPPAAQLADVGAGCGYIGLTMAIAWPQAQVTLVESLERRCKFMHWAALQVGAKNVRVQQARLGQGTQFAFDAVTERAMGPLPEIAPICLDAVKAGGIFLAFQGEHPQTADVHTPQARVLAQTAYQLPCDNKTRHLVLFKKHDA